MSDKLQTLRNTLSLSYLDSIQKSKKKYASLMEPLCRGYDLTRSELEHTKDDKRRGYTYRVVWDNEYNNRVYIMGGE